MMAAIPPEIIFVLLFIAFSVLEGMGRRRKARERKAPGAPPGPSPEEPGTRQEERPAPPPAEATASRREVPGRREPPARREVPAGGRPEAQRPRGQGSEGMIPKEIWEEILGLARGEPPRPKPPEPGPEARPVPATEAETLEEIPPFEARSLEPLHVEREGPGKRPREAPIRRGAPPSRDLAARRGGTPQAKGKEALPVARDGVPGSKERQRRRPRRGGLREDLLGDGAPEDLRKAIILTEVLGPPLALRGREEGP